LHALGSVTGDRTGDEIVHLRAASEILKRSPHRLRRHLKAQVKSLRDVSERLVENGSRAQSLPSEWDRRKSNTPSSVSKSADGPERRSGRNVDGRAPIANPKYVIA
jgi:hypothetical protein